MRILLQKEVYRTVMILVYVISSFIISPTEQGRNMYRLLSFVSFCLGIR